MQLSSPQFQQGGPIPAKHTGDGDDTPPTLEWRDVPNGTRSFVLYCEDPDAPRGTFHHWAVWDIPANCRRLDEALAGGSLPHQAVNDFGKPGYGGPLPPRGDRPHHYHFRLVALGREHLPVSPAARADEVVAAARPYVLDQAELISMYAR